MRALQTNSFVSPGFASFCVIFSPFNTTSVSIANAQSIGALMGVLVKGVFGKYTGGGWGGGGGLVGVVVVGVVFPKKPLPKTPLTPPWLI